MRIFIDFETIEELLKMGWDHTSWTRQTWQISDKKSCHMAHPVFKALAYDIQHSVRGPIGLIQMYIKKLHYVNPFTKLS